MKAPSQAAAISRLGERARAEGWTREEFLPACLEREAAAADGSPVSPRPAPPAGSTPSSPASVGSPLIIDEVGYIPLRVVFGEPSSAPP